jgi:hypothetical protein
MHFKYAYRKELENIGFPKLETQAFLIWGFWIIYNNLNNSWLLLTLIGYLSFASQDCSISEWTQSVSTHLPMIHRCSLDLRGHRRITPSNKMHCHRLSLSIWCSHQNRRDSSNLKYHDLPTISIISSYIGQALNCVIGCGPNSWRFKRSVSWNSHSLP